MKPERIKTTQSDASVAKNISFFNRASEKYKRDVYELDTYKAIRGSVNDALKGVDRLLDIGSGGVFNYDTGIVSNIVAVDLFFGSLQPHSVPQYPANITFQAGSAMAIPADDESFDGVLIVMLLHHLLGPTVTASLKNLQLAASEALRVLRPGGKLIVIESCVPPWFYAFEKAVFPMATRVIERISNHPATLQYPASLIEQVLKQNSTEIEVTCIPKGKWVLQYGVKFPSVLTPVNVHRFVIRK